MKCSRIAPGLVGLVLLTILEISAFAEPAEISGIDKVYLRAGPGTETEPLIVLNAGDRVNTLGNEGNWTKVETSDGKVGFVYHRYVLASAEAGAAAPSPRAVPPAEGATAASAGLAEPSPTAAGEAPKDAVAAEIAGLRAQLADLRQKVQERAAENAEPLGTNGIAPSSGSAIDAPAAAPTPSAREQGVGVLAVALLSLLVGWVLGSAFGRRRSRSQRPRLRF